MSIFSEIESTVFKNEDDAELLKEKFEKKFKIKGWTKKLKV